ncbi:MAG: hypothetical protein J6L92_07655 [Clostridia bacterium]|nr:hypothetical protein [Clostridia bacterium]
MKVTFVTLSFIILENCAKVNHFGGNSYYIFIFVTLKPSKNRFFDDFGPAFLEKHQKTERLQKQYCPKCGRITGRISVVQRETCPRCRHGKNIPTNGI